MQTKSVWVAGEVLIDLISNATESSAIVGGGAANTARALAGLGVQTSFIGGISSDEYGQRAAAELVEAGVGLEFALRSDLPTAKALIDVSNGAPSYQFQLEETATFEFARDWLPSGNPIAVHVGSLASIIKPGCEALFEWATLIEAPILFDPNIRPNVLGDVSKYRELVEKWFSIADVVKLSEDDLDYLYLGKLSDLLEFGPSLVVLTRGEQGITAFTSEGLVDVPGVAIEVVDTVGAGDTVGAVLAEAIAKFGLTGLLGEALSATLNRAARAAAITCSRAGAQPPKASELV